MSTKKNRQRDKKNAKRAEKLKRRQARQHRSEQVRSIHANAPQVKAALRAKGCDLPFYDFLDSYADEFARTVDEAKRQHPTLVAVHEVERVQFREIDWSALGYANYQQIIFETDDDVGDYGSDDPAANLSGKAAAFRDRNNELRTVIVLRRRIERNMPRDMQYALKVAALLHEIGHVHDIENRINFDVDARRANVLEGEVFANLFCLDKLASRQLLQSYAMVANALREASVRNDFLGEVARRVLQRLPDHRLVDWQGIELDPPT